MTTFKNMLAALSGDKEIQIYGGRRIPITLTKQEWLECRDENIMDAPVYKVKDRVTDIYTFVEIGECPET